MAASFGIDLGSSQCTLASIPLTFVSENLTWENASTVVSVPSCLSLDEQGHLQTIDKSSTEHPITGFKEALDKPEALWNIGESQFSAMELSAVLMKRLYQQLTVPIARIHPSTITYPSYFLSLGRDQLANAAKLAGYNVGYLISDAVATANFFAYNQQILGKTLVINWGTNSLTLDVIDVQESKFVELSSEYSRSWGSAEIDSLIYNFYQSRYKEISGADLATDEIKRSQFLNAAEEAKKLLTTVDPINATIGNEEDGFIQIELNNKILAEIQQPLLTHLQFLVEQLEQNLQSSGQTFEHVILTGGGALMSSIAKAVEEITGMAPLISESPRTDVAQGAALYALNPKAVEVISHHAYGTASLALNPKTQKEEVRNMILIPKGSSLPGSLTQSFATSSAGDDSIELEITEGDDSNMDFARVLGKLAVRLSPTPPEGSEIRLTLECDRFERISVNVLDVAANKNYQVSLQLEGEGITHQKQNSYHFRDFIKDL